jgi:hypothetical protein
MPVPVLVVVVIPTATLAAAPLELVAIVVFILILGGILVPLAAAPLVRSCAIRVPAVGRAHRGASARPVRGRRGMLVVGVHLSEVFAGAGAAQPKGARRGRRRIVALVVIGWRLRRVRIR